MSTSPATSTLALSLSLAAGLTLAAAPALADPAGRPMPLSVDLLPFVGSSSAAPDARRVVSLNLVGGLAGGLDALELGGAFNVQTGRVRGLQIAGALNVVDGEVDGVQIAGAINVANGPVEGAQVGGAVNVANGRVAGAQIGVVNVASGEVEGAQIGVINVAPRARAGIGLVNVYWDGWAEADVAITETTLTLAGVRHGSGALYNVYYAGTRLDRPSDLTVGIGIGGRWQLATNLELSLDVTTFTTAIEGRFTGMHSLTSLRPQIAWRITEAVALWAGPTLNVLATDHTEVDHDLPATAVRLSEPGEDVQVWLWPGVAAGVRLF